MFYSPVSSLSRLSSRMFFKSVDAPLGTISLTHTLTPDFVSFHNEREHGKIFRIEFA